MKNFTITIRPLQNGKSYVWVEGSKIAKGNPTDIEFKDFASCSAEDMAKVLAQVEHVLRGGRAVMSDAQKSQMAADYENNSYQGD